MADWNQCMVDALAGKVSSCPAAPSSVAPSCEADEAGDGLPGRSPATAGNGSSRQNVQAELDNAKSASMSAYQQAIDNGRAGSGALLDATLSGAQQISDPSTSLVYTGVGLGLSLLSHMGEKKAKRKEAELKRKEMELQQQIEELEAAQLERQQAEEKKEQAKLEAERKAGIIAAKKTFTTEALNINRYTIGQLLTRARYASVMLTPKEFTPLEQPIYFTMPVKVPPHADSTYPLAEAVRSKLISSLNKELTSNYKTELLYPITDIDKFTDEFVKKMGSGTVISLDANLLEFIKPPYQQGAAANANNAGFWKEPVKKEEKKKEEPVKKQKSFWDQ
jgi:hypothetical protein